MATINSMGLRPIASLTGPAINMANMAEKEGELTTHPSSISDKLNSGVINRLTPEMTDASKPNKNPPMETIRAMKMLYPFDFILLI